MQTKFHTSQIDVKFNADAPTLIKGYASVFGGVDSYGDRVMKGAYSRTLQNRLRPVQMRWQHFGPVIGKWTNLMEDEKGLYVVGELTPGHSVANDVAHLLKHQAISGLSIGYSTDDTTQNGVIRELNDIELFEISVVESPADIAATVSDVKSAIRQAESLKEIESLLRDAGRFSRADAAALVSRIKSLSHGDRVDAEASEIKGQLAQILSKL